MKQIFRVLFFATVFLPTSVQAKIKVTSARLSFSQPETAHNLVLQQTNSTTFFDLEPKNNERIGLFLKINSLLIGYSLDLFKADQETQTTHIDIITEKYDFSRIGFNIQILKGFDSKARSFETNEREAMYFPEIESQRFELFGLHNLKTYYGKSLFNHFFLNRPVDGEEIFGVSLVGDWKVRHLKLSSPSGVIYTPSFLNGAVTALVPEIRALSASTSAGPMVSIGLKNRLNAFVSSTFGLGYFDNLTKTTDLKESGFEFLQSYRGGVSWNSKHKNFMINSKISYQRGRHIETTFGSVTFLYFF